MNRAMNRDVQKVSVSTKYVSGKKNLTAGNRGCSWKLFEFLRQSHSFHMTVSHVEVRKQTGKTEVVTARVEAAAKS